jgi:hypothetical protein
MGAHKHVSLVCALLMGGMVACTAERPPELTDEGCPAGVTEGIPAPPPTNDPCARCGAGDDADDECPPGCMLDGAVQTTAYPVRIPECTGRCCGGPPATAPDASGGPPPLFGGDAGSAKRDGAAF